MENKTSIEILRNNLDENHISGLVYENGRLENCIIKAMHEYGKQQYNQAVLDCIEMAKVKGTWINKGRITQRKEYSIDKESMKKLLKQ
ncbi:MAG: hypothetical protein ACM3KI_11055 [Bacillota bacterium]